MYKCIRVYNSIYNSKLDVIFYMFLNVYIFKYLSLSVSDFECFLNVLIFQVRAHYTLFLDDCTLIESSRDNEGEPFEFVTGIGQHHHGHGHLHPHHPQIDH